MNQESMMGRWDYAITPNQFYFGPDERFIRSYTLGMDFLRSCAAVEDWGCGTAYAKRFCHGLYRGVDGSASQWTDEVVDLVKYCTQVEGIFMRHVLEHNHEWGTILDNAIASFTKRMALIFYIPFGPVTTVLGVSDRGVPDIRFRFADVAAHLDYVKVVELKTFDTDETLVFLEK